MSFLENNSRYNCFTCEDIPNHRGIFRKRNFENWSVIIAVRQLFSALYQYNSYRNEKYICFAE